jgi:hypothetical protein
MGKVRRRRESGLHFGSVVDRGEGERGAAQIRGRRSRNGGRPIRDHGRGCQEGHAAVWACVQSTGPITGWGWASGRFRLAARYCCNGPVPVQHPNNFFKHSNDSKLHSMKLVLPQLKIFSILAWYYINLKGTTLLLRRNSNSQQNLK